MRYVKWGFLLVLALIVGAFLHYTLPQTDIVRITNTFNRQTTIGSNWMFYASSDSGSAETEVRDIRFIEAVRPNDKVIVYRNEDTGWIWPPYFKYDSSNLQAEASNLKSDKATPQWVKVTHYGWRIPLISIYPNAVSATAIEGPDVRIIPWFNIVFLSFLALALLMVRRMWLQFRERTIDPLIDEVEDKFDEVSLEGQQAARKARGLVARLFGRKG